MLLIDKKISKKIKYIASHLGEWSVTEKIGEEQIIWFVEFDQPDLSYEFNQSRMGVSNNGKFVWQGTSGCSCPTPYEEGRTEGDYYEIGETINLGEVEVLSRYKNPYLDADWEKQLSESVDRIYTALRWPEKLTAQQILEEKNQEFRRVLIEKMGMESFVKKAQPEMLDSSDVGQLLKIDLKGDEPIVLLVVKDSSTPRKYMLRVPPDMKTAIQAKAWTFGMNPEEFNLIKET